MKTAQEIAYIHALVAVFSAAFELGYDPYALAVQAKVDLQLFDEDVLEPFGPIAERIINESLLVAKIRSC